MGYFIKIIQILIWPTTTIILAYIFKKPLSDLIANIVTIKYKDFEAKFAKRLEDLKKDAKNLPCSLNVAVSESINARENTLEEILESTGLDLYVKLAKIDPISAVMESWRKLAHAIIEKAKKLGEQHSIKNAIEILSKKGIIDKGEKHMIKELYSLRNESLYTSNSKLTFLDAIKYAELADRLTCYVQGRDYK
jgi:hypothetical protein